MSIADRTGHGESITEGWRAFDLFTDRFDLIHNFASYLNDYPAKERILYFWGEGGNGKSLLLKFLQEHCCKYIDARNWEWIKSKSEEEFAERLKSLRGAEYVPSALLDFNPNPGGDATIQDPFSALLTMRRALTHPNLHYPLFDFACAWYLANGGKLTDQQRQYLLLAEGTKFIAKIIDAITKNVYGAVATAVLNLYNKDLTEWFHLYTRRRKLSAETIKEIQRLTPESKLLTHLPSLFAEDLNNAMLIEGAPKRVALFFDAHEAFWGIEHKLSEDLFFQRDEWLRSLLAHLELSRGIVVVVAGREPPRWAEATKPGTIISEDFIDLQRVAPLSEEHALQYLQRAGIDDVVMRQCLVAYAHVGPRQVHPLYLGLCSDVVLAAREKGRRLTPEEFQSTKDTTDKGTELIRRLLRYVDDDIAYPVRALSACRAFDKELYFRLGEALKLGVTEQSFNALIRFSFVWRAQRLEPGLYRIHEILRRVFYEREDEINRRANEFLYKYYSRRGDNVALAESTYHSNRMHGGVDGWLLCFHSGMEFGQYELCRLLLEVRNELKINRGVELGRVLDQEGEYFERIAKYEEAEQSFVAATMAFNEALLEYPQSADIYDLKGHTLHNLGTLQARLSRHTEAYKSYREALATFNIILRQIPDHRSNTGKGLTLVAVGDLLALRSKTERAVNKYEEAIHIFEDDVKRWSGHADSHGHLAHAHASVGNIQFERSQYDEAIVSFKKAITAYDEAIRQLPVFFRFYQNKANRLVDLGDVHFRLKQYEQAEKSYINAVASYDKALQHSRDTTACWDGKGVALRHLGDVQVVRLHGVDAKDSYEKAMASFNEALSLSPGDISPKFNKATALQSLGNLIYETGNTEEWVAIYNGAITLFDDLLEKAPDFILAYNNKGLTLMKFGQLYLLEGKFKDAEHITRKAIATLDKATELSPGYVFAHNNKGRALRNLAFCLYWLGDYESAAKASKEAEREFSWSTKTAPRDSRIHQEIAGVRSFLTIFDEDRLNERPSVDEDLSLHEGALDQFLELVGESSAPLEFKSSGNANRDFNSLLQVLSRTEADKKVDDLLGRLNKQYQAAIKSNPQNHLVLRHWGSLLHHWAMIKTGVEADRLFALACEKYEGAFHDPCMHWVLNDWGVVLCDWAKTKCGDEADRLFKLACEKHEASLKIKPTKEEAYLNWGGALYAQALNKSDKDADPLLVTACEKYAAGLQIRPDDFKLLHNWGLALKERAFGASGDESDQLFELACEKFELALEVKADEETSLTNLEHTLSQWGDVIRKRNGTKDPTELKHLYESIFKHFEIALRFNPNQEKIFYFWGNALMGQAGITNDYNARDLLSLANEKFQTAVDLKPDLYPAFVAWGTALLELARIKSEESQVTADQLFEASCEKFETAVKLQPNLWESIVNWGGLFAEWAKRKSGDESIRLRRMAYEKFDYAVTHAPDEYKSVALHAWGVTLIQHAGEEWSSDKLKEHRINPETKDLIRASIDKFDQAYQLNSNDADSLVMWGRALDFQAVITPWSTMGEVASKLYAEACSKFKEALRIRSDDTSLLEMLRDCLTRWSGVLCQLATTENTKTSIKLLFRACEKLEEAHEIDPRNSQVLRDWGIALYEVATIRGGEKLVWRLNLAREKLAASLSSQPDDQKAQLYLSRTERAIAMTEMNEEERQLLQWLLDAIREAGYEV